MLVAFPCHTLPLPPLSTSITYTEPSCNTGAPLIPLLIMLSIISNRSPTLAIASAGAGVPGETTFCYTSV